MSARACLLSDGRPGHVNQSLGVLAALPAEQRTHSRFELPAPRRAWKHPVLLLARVASHSTVLLRGLFRLYYGVAAPQKVDGNWLLSTGGDTLVASILLARIFGIPNVFVGKQSAATASGVSLLFSIEGTEIPGRVVVLEFGPVNVTVEAPPAQRSNLLAVLVGGESNEYHYTANDYRELAQALDRLCTRTGARLLLTTSRRTGAEGEAALRAALPAQHIADATWYQQAPRPVVHDYCRRADAVLCSEDSGTMLCEALYFSRPVFAFHPAARRMTPFYARFLDKLAGRGVGFCALAALDSINPEGATPELPADAQRIREAVTALLARQRPPH